MRARKGRLRPVMRSTMRPSENARARRLLSRDGEWALEVEDLCSDDGTIYKQKVEVVRGAAEILSFLEGAPEHLKQYLATTRQILHQPLRPEIDGITYTLGKGGWEETDSHASAAVPKVGAALESLAEKMAEMESKITDLPGAVTRLEEGIVRMEHVITQAREVFRTLETFFDNLSVRLGAVDGDSPSPAVPEPPRSKKGGGSEPRTLDDLAADDVEER